MSTPDGVVTGVIDAYSDALAVCEVEVPQISLARGAGCGGRAALRAA